jgi:hypothetical protein
MASEITIEALLTFLKNSLTATLALARTTFTMSGANYIHRTQSILVTDTTLDLASLATPGLALFINRGPSTIVKIKNAAAGTIIPKLKVGEIALFRLDTSVTAPVAIATALTITAASNAAAAKMTCAGHLLATGNLVTISGFTGGWTGCNGTFSATYVDASNFTIPVDSTAFGALAGSPVMVSSSLEYLILED